MASYLKKMKKDKSGKAPWLIYTDRLIHTGNIQIGERAYAKYPLLLINFDTVSLYIS